MQTVCQSATGVICINKTVGVFLPENIKAVTVRNRQAAAAHGSYCTPPAFLSAAAVAFGRTRMVDLTQ